MTTSNIMAPRIAVLKNTTPILPATAGSIAVHKGIDNVWNAIDDTWHEFRHPTTGKPLVVQKVATAVIGGTTYVLAVFWGLGPDRVTIDGTLYPGVIAALRTAGVLVADWACNLNPDGRSIGSTALTADVGAAATQVKANWPASWPSSPLTIGDLIA